MNRFEKFIPVRTVSEANAHENYAMRSRLTISDGELSALFNQYKSVNRVGKLLGVSGETVRVRLNKAGRKKRKYWTPDEDRRICEYYETADPKMFSLKTISDSLGRSRFSVAVRAGRLGVTDPQREKSGLHVGRQDDLPWSKWVKHPHPRGMRGKHHSQAVRDRQSRVIKGAWDESKRMGTGYMSASQQQRRSDLLHVRNQTDPRLRRGYSRCRSGRRADLGDTHFRSAWEANIARYLNFLQSRCQIEKWEYEPDTFWFEKIKRGVRSYLPDFKVWERGQVYYIEVKGWMDAKSKTKLKRMKKYHPSVRIDVIDQKRYAGIKRTAAAIISNWE